MKTIIRPCDGKSSEIVFDATLDYNYRDLNHILFYKTTLSEDLNQ